MRNRSRFFFFLHRIDQFLHHLTPVSLQFSTLLQCSLDLPHGCTIQGWSEIWAVVCPIGQHSRPLSCCVGSGPGTDRGEATHTALCAHSLELPPLQHHHPRIAQLQGPSSPFPGVPTRKSGVWSLSSAVCFPPLGLPLGD